MESPAELRDEAERQSAAYDQSRRELVRNALFGEPRKKHRFKGIAPGWSTTPEQAADEFARKLPFGLPVIFDAEGSVQGELYPSPAVARRRLAAIEKRTRALMDELGALGVGLESQLDRSAPSGEGQEERGIVDRVSVDLGNLGKAHEAVLAAMDAGRYKVPSERELRIACMVKLIELYRECFGQDPGLSIAGPFMRLVHALFEERGIRSTALYRDARQAMKRYREAPRRTGNPSSQPPG